jgi:predicted dehydrogenase
MKGGALRVGVVGCGLIGRRRATVAAAGPDTTCVVVADPVAASAAEVAAASGAEVVPDWRVLVGRRDVDAVVVATPNGFLAEIAIAALAAGKHVLVEKPMGRNLAEAEEMRAAACRGDRVLKIGFNHRYHPGIAEARRLVQDGAIGEVINLHCRYGHGGRPGYEREWRGNRALAGGGELLDQGVHVVDLIHWFAGVPAQAFGFLQTAVWPLGDLEDNAFGLFRFDSGAVAALHTSWTQWKNLFVFEVYGRSGAVVVNGLGKSYGAETLSLQTRRPEGGAPEVATRTFEGEDDSWRLEWEDFVHAVRGEQETGSTMLGNADDGIVAMKLVDALYRSAAAKAPVDV